jgi:chromosome segregation ATPase
MKVPDKDAQRRRAGTGAKRPKKGEPHATRSDAGGIERGGAHGRGGGLESRRLNESGPAPRSARVRLADEIEALRFELDNALADQSRLEQSLSLILESEPAQIVLGDELSRAIGSTGRLGAGAEQRDAHVAELRQSCEPLKNGLNESEGLLVDRAAEIETLEDALVRDRVSIAELERRALHSDAQLAESTKHSMQLEADLRQAETRLAERTEHIESIERMLARERASVAELEERAGRGDAQVMQLHQLVERLKAHLHDAEARITERTACAERSEKKLAEAQEGLAVLAATVAKLNAEASAREDRAERLEKALQQADQKFVRQRDQVAGVEVRLSQQRQRAAEMEDELASLSTKYTSVLDQQARARDHFLQEHARTLQLSRTVLQQEGELASSRSALGSITAELAEHTQATGRRIAELQRELAETQEEYRQAIERESALEASLRVGLIESIEMTDRVKRAESASAEHGGQIAILEQVIQKQEKLLNEILGSGSWRMTAFWRAYKRMLSKIRGVWLRGTRTNPLFDREWYLQQYDDVNVSEIDPFDHYLRFGAIEGRNPNALFDTRWYLAQNPDVKESGINPLIHFYTYGAAEGRDPHPFFAMTWHRRWNSSNEGKDTNAIINHLRSVRRDNRRA